MAFTTKPFEFLLSHQRRVPLGISEAALPLPSIGVAFTRPKISTIAFVAINTNQGLQPQTQSTPATVLILLCPSTFKNPIVVSSSPLKI